MSFVGDSVEKTFSKKRICYVDALELYIPYDLVILSRYVNETIYNPYIFFPFNDKALLIFLCVKIYISLLDGWREH